MWKSMLVLLLISSLVLAACGNKEEAGVTTTSDGKRVLKVWGMGGEDNAISTLIPAFEKKYPDIKVETQFIPWDNAHDKLLTAVASKKGPDVIQMGTTWIPEFADAGALLDLTPYTEEFPNLKPENFFKGAQETMTVNDQLVGIPWYLETRVLFYRTDLLKQVGYNEAPKSWAELKDAATKLTDKSKGRYGILLDTQDAAFTLPYAWENGSEVISNDNKAQFNQPAYIETIEYLTSFFKEGLTPNQSDIKLLPSFGQGLIPMFVSGPWSANQIKTDLPDLKADQWATAIIPPKEEGGKSASILGGSNWSVFSSATNKDDAAKFIAFMSDPETQVAKYKHDQDLPANMKAWDNEVFNNKPIVQTFRDQLDTARPSPFVKSWESIGDLIKAALQQITIGGADIKEQMEEVNTGADSLLAE